MLLDLIALSLIALAFLRGYKRGIIVAVFSLLSIVIGSIAALKLSATVSEHFFSNGGKSSGWMPLVTYIVLFILIVLLVRWGAKLLDTAASAVMLGLFNRLGGGLLYGFMAVFIWSAILYLIGGAGIISPETIAASKTYAYIVPVAPWVFDHIGVVLPFVKNIFSDLTAFFDSVNHHVGTH